jgi:hypothetical protein
VLSLAACDKNPLPTEMAEEAATPAAEGLLLASGGLPGQFGGDFEMPLAMRAMLTTSGCTNHPGPYVTLSGAMTLGGFGVEMIFRNNEKGTHEYTDEMRADLTVIPAGESITIPKQPVLGGTGGNPFIWVQFTNAAGAAISDEIYIGRCVQGASTPVNADLGLAAVAVAQALAEGCSNNPGPWITLEGDVTLGGIGARVIFRNNDNPVGGPHEADRDAVNFTLLADGNVIRFPKQPVLGGVGGNPWIWAQLEDGAGLDLSDEILLGRCVQLSKS